MKMETMNPKLAEIADKMATRQPLSEQDKRLLWEGFPDTYTTDTKSVRFWVRPANDALPE